MALLALLLPTLALSAELKGTVEKVDSTKNQILLKTEKGMEALEITKCTKGIEHAKQGARVTIKLGEKDGSTKIAEIAAGS